MIRPERAQITKEYTIYGRGCVVTYGRRQMQATFRICEGTKIDVSGKKKKDAQIDL